MALSEQQKLFIVQKMGYDPSQYTTDDDGNNLIIKSQGQPTISSPQIISYPQQPTTPQHSAAGAFGLNLAQNIPGAVGGGVGAGIASMALPGALAALGLGETSTGVGSLIGIPTMALAAYLGSKGASKLTEAIEPDSLKQNVQESAQEHPTAAMLGNLASIPFGGLSPSVSGLAKPGYGAASGLGKLLIGMERTPQESANLLNVAAGAGLGAGQNAVESLANNGSVDPRSMIESAAIGALFNKPNTIGKLYGFHGIPQDISEQLQGTLANGGQQQKQPQITTTPQVDPDVLEYQQAQNRVNVLRQNSSGMDVGLNYSIDPNTGQYKISKKKSENITPRYSAAESALHMDQLLRDNAPVEKRSAQIDDTIRQTQMAEMQRQQAEQELQQQLRARAEIARQKAAQLQSENAANAMELKNGLGPKFQQTTPKPLATTELGNDIMPDFTGTTEHDNAVNKQESAADLEQRRLEGYDDKYQTGANPSTKFEEETLSKAKAQNLPLNPTSKWFEILKPWIEKMKGIQTDISGVPTDLEGNPVAGQTILKNGVPQLIRANLTGKRNLAGSDTLPHEVDHALMAAMENSKHPRDQRFMQKYYDIISKTPEYQEWAKNTAGDNSPNEYAAQNGGYEFLRRHLNLDGESSFQKWLGDIRSYWKTRFTEHADEGDYRRMLNYDMMYGKKKLGEFGGAVAGNIAIKNQGQSDTSDRSKYDELSKQMSELIKNHQYGTPEFNTVWKQLEEVKNKHGGMPPEVDIKNSPSSGTSPDSDKVSPDNETVLETIKAAIRENYKDFDKADESHAALRDQVDWSAYPNIGHRLNSNDFDASKQSHWTQLLHMYGEYQKTAKPNSLANALAGVSVDEKGNISQQEVNEQNEAKAKAELAKEVHQPAPKVEQPASTLDAIQAHKEKLLEERKALAPDSPEENAKRQEINKLIDLEEQVKKQNRAAGIPETTTKETPKIEGPKKVYPSDSYTYVDGGIDSLGRKTTMVLDKQGNLVKTNVEQLPKKTVERSIPSPLSDEEIKSRRDMDRKELMEIMTTKDPYKLAQRMREDFSKAMNHRMTLYEDLQKASTPELERKWKDVNDRLETLQDFYRRLQFDKGLRKLPLITGAMPSEWTKRQSYNPSENHLEQTKTDYRGNDLKMSQYSQLPLVRPQLEVAREKSNEYGHNEGDKFADAYNSYAMHKDNTYGKGMYPILQAAKGLTEKQLNHVDDIGIRSFRDKQDYSGQLSPKELGLYNAIKQSLLEKQNDQIAANQPVTDYRANGTPFKRLPQIDPYYWPNRMAKNIPDIIADPTQRAKLAQMKSDFIAHKVQYGNTQAAAEEAWNSIIKAYSHGEVNLSKFNANRESAGVGLPDSMLRKGELMKNLSAYYTRVAADRAFHDTFESDPENAKLIGIDKDAWGNAHPQSQNEFIGNVPEVKSALEKVYGEGYDHSERMLKSSSRLATSLMLGPLTNIHIAASSLANSLQYTNPTYSAQAFLHGITHMTEGLQHALQTGYERKDFGTFRDIFDAQSSTTDKLAALARTISNAGGRELTNKLTKGYLQAFGEYVVKQKAIEANNGSKEALNLMTHIDPEWTQGKQYAPDELQKVSSNFASLIHGAHDARTLPNWMLKDTAIQPFFQLASWNIAQTNQWMRHVWTPATQGNFTPLLMSTLGATLGGYVIKELREKVSDKKSAIPSLEELVNSSRGLSGNANNVAYNLMAMSSFVGYAGIISTLGKAAEDLAHKNIPQGAAFPLDEVISNPAKRIGQYISAMINDPNMDYIQSGVKLFTDVAKENFQLARLGISWAANSSDLIPQEHYLKSLNQKTQNYRRFQMAEGMPYEAQTVNEANPYLNSKLKTFKRTSDIGEAAELLPSLIENAFTKANGNPDVLKNELQKIKQNSYETLPNPDRMPLSFVRYMTYVSQKEGPQKATELLTDYLGHNAINKAKESMVPSLGQ